MRKNLRCAMPIRTALMQFDIAIDRHDATQVITHLQDDGFKVSRYGQDFANMNAPAKGFGTACLSAAGLSTAIIRLRAGCMATPLTGKIIAATSSRIRNARRQDRWRCRRCMANGDGDRQYGGRRQSI
jgi:hypothetical protein